MTTILSSIAALALAFAPAFGDECASPCSEYRCDNQCPLAVEANAHRAHGDEAVLASKLVREERADELARNLARI